MAVLYKVVEDTRDGSLTQGQWFGRAVHTNAINTKQIAEEIQENVSVKYSDVSAVLIELINVMNRHLNQSERVVLDGFGSFKIGLKTKGALRKEDFTATKNIVGSRLNFCPEWKVNKEGRRIKAFLDGVTVKNAEEVINGKKKADEEPTP